MNAQYATARVGRLARQTLTAAVAVDLSPRANQTPSKHVPLAIRNQQAFGWRVNGDAQRMRRGDCMMLLWHQCVVVSRR